MCFRRGGERGAGAGVTLPEMWRARVGKDKYICMTYGETRLAAAGRYGTGRVLYC
ncbi:hypothetical protein CHLRE_17g726526v5 [Chlamydomonas reinhardtii]|uniref:Uncharacterized protein n=1 Tax=Chlamydomonas reinhardtii TaxID=3055 RepID=A0A2K3CQN1_CHLRE|nr:uncharacterized protein CHLRE_17g726526v5 [Chlamydomonas reinhardtii]PNW70597.1 hypothetical protein CHLRE_17g726526v5 [Chlamydomonas reinhardtii]